VRKIDKVGALGDCGITVRREQLSSVPFVVEKLENIQRAALDLDGKKKSQTEEENRAIPGR
jgi:hypothetical protein